MLTAVLLIHTLFGGSGGMAVLCLGGGHEHGPTEIEHCESACIHGSWWLQPAPPGEHAHECACADVELRLAELLTLPRGDDECKFLPAVVSTPAWGLLIADSGLGRRGPPIPPPWFDPRRAQCLKIVASVRLII